MVETLANSVPLGNRKVTKLFGAAVPEITPSVGKGIDIVADLDVDVRVREVVLVAGYIRSPAFPIPFVKKGKDPRGAGVPAL